MHRATSPELGSTVSLSSILQEVYKADQEKREPWEPSLNLSPPLPFASSGVL